nr:2OG-Fe(II) oxygenase [Alteromonas hispanica]
MGKVHDTSEPIQAQHYDIDQEFKQHTDYFEPGSSEYSKFAGRRGQRSWTCMVYLNTVERGGDTEFLHLKKRFSPKQGDVLVWCNVDKNGIVNPKSLHQAHPVEAGEKYVITQWCRLPATK